MIFSAHNRGNSGNRADGALSVQGVGLVTLLPRKKLVSVSFVELQP